MKSIKELKQRLRSIRNTAKVTKTLYMVSASRMRQIQKTADSSTDYIDQLREIAHSTAILQRRLQDIGTESSKFLPYFKPPLQTNAKPLVLLIAPSRGFCGSLISKQIHLLKKELDPTKQYYGIGMQKKSAYIFQKFSNVEVQAIFNNSIEQVNSSTVQAEFTMLLDNYLVGMYSEIKFVYAKFINTFTYKIVFESFLPFHVRNFIQPNTNITLEKFPLVEPSTSEFLNELIKRYLKSLFLYYVIQTKASEHSARMIAMKSATDNAQKLGDNLKLELNRARQEAITSELLDIMGGMVATN